MSDVSILSTILAHKRVEIAQAKRDVSLASLEQACAHQAPTRGFKEALRRAENEPVRLIAEFKRASPSAGAIRAGADPVAIGRAYEAAGASAISVLTDKSFFDGDLAFVGRVRDAVSIPLLRKDFIVDPYQVVEARAAGADAILLIVAALGDDKLIELLGVAQRYDLDALVEVHDVAEAERAVRAGATLIGVNHRNLATFEVDMTLTARLRATLPADVVVVGESGIRSPDDVRALGYAGAHAVLVGETLMRASSPGDAARTLCGLSPAPARSLVKICGITTVEGARACVRAGVDWLGVNFWPQSKRYVDARGREHGRLVCEAIRDECTRTGTRVQIVGVFVNQPEGIVARIAEYVGLDAIQLHGEETEAVCAMFLKAGLNVIKAMGLRTPEDAVRLADYPCRTVLADTPSPGYGGSGQTFDWSLANHAALADKHLILAGGLCADNVAAAIQAVRPFAVDVASGVESAPGIKDPERVAAFMTAVAGANRS